MFLNGFRSHFADELVQLIGAHEVRALIVHGRVKFAEFDDLHGIPFQIGAQEIGIQVIAARFQGQIESIRKQLSVGGVIGLQADQKNRLLENLQPRIFLLDHGFFLRFLRGRLRHFRFLVLPFSSGFLSSQAFRLKTGFFLRLRARPFLRLPARRLQFRDFPRTRRFRFRLLSGRQLSGGSLTLNGNPVVSYPSGGKSQHQDNSHNNSAGRGFFMLGKTGTQRIDRIHGDAA